MAPVASLREYEGRLAGLDPELFVGSILWFTIAGTVERADGKRTSVPVRIKHDQLEVWFDELNLDKSFIPPTIKAVDAFRKATGEVTREYMMTDSQTALLMVREVTFDDEKVVRHIVKEMRDKRGEKLTYEPNLATLKFRRPRRNSKGRIRGSESWDVQVTRECSYDDQPHVEDMLKEINERYIDLSANLHSQAIRGMIREYVVSLNAIAVKSSGGVYFVHNSRQDTVDGLEELVRRIGQGCSFHQLPLLDTPKQRTMLTEAFQDEVEDDIRKLLADISTYNEQQKGGKVTAAKYAEFNGRFQEVMARSEEYTKVLGLAQGRAGAALELALGSVVDLANRVGR